MRALVPVLCLLASTTPLLAQQNPFQSPRKLKPVSVTYQYGGDMTGTGEQAMAGNRSVTRSHITGKFFGKTSTTDSWTLLTPDSLYTANLDKKTGTRQPNMLPHMARAYDDLSKSDKQRLHQNMKDMADMLGQAFGTGIMGAEEKVGTRTYAGQSCEEMRFGSWSVCNMSSPPVTLHAQGNLFCVDFEQTATAVSLGEPPASAFDPPAGITFQPEAMAQDPDSVARGFVLYLASKELSDSIAAARQKMQEQHASAGQAQGQDQQPQMTEEQRKQACDALKNFSLSKMMSDAAKQAFNDLVEQEKEAAKESAKNKLKGLIKKPKFP